jgi:hypothetical protein
MLLAILTHQQAILADSTRWTRVALARTTQLEPVVPLSDRAWCWSLSGAQALALFEVLGGHVAQRDWQRLYDLAIDALWDGLPDEQPRTERRGADVDGFNDYFGTDFRDVANLIDRAVRAQAAVDDRDPPSLAVP